MARGNWLLRLLWVFGTLGRVLVFAAVEGAALAWAAYDAAQAASVSTAAIGIAVLTVAAQCVVAALWAVPEGIADFASRTVLLRWILVSLAAMLVAPIYNQTGDVGPPDYGLLLSDVAGGFLIFGVPVVISAVAGWTLGRALRSSGHTGRSSALGAMGGTA